MPKLDVATAWASFEAWRADPGQQDEPVPTATDLERGRVKFFDILKGIGIIEAQAGNAFLGGKVVEGAGIDPWVGDIIEFERQAPQRGRTDVAMRPRIVSKGRRITGHVKYFGEGSDGGYHGYVHCDQTREDVYVAGTVVRREGIETLRTGQRVEFVTSSGAHRAGIVRIRKTD